MLEEGCVWSVKAVDNELKRNTYVDGKGRRLRFEGVQCCKLDREKERAEIYT